MTAKRGMMSTEGKGGKMTRKASTLGVTAFLFLTLLMASCNMNFTTGQPSGPEPDSSDQSDLVACPKAGDSMLLKFSANIKITHEGAEINHDLQDGLLNLMVMPDGSIQAVEGTQIPFTMNGVMGPCTLEGGGNMSPSAVGLCQNGVVYLTIMEDWGPYQGTMTCPDVGEVPFNTPSLGLRTHTGADGKGEVFYLDKNFSPSGAGYTTMREFAGPGEGRHVWTLFWDYTAPTK
jgi:hypothetical protein